MIDLPKIGEWLGKYGVQVILILSVFIQISPIKINPWSKLFKWIGKIITEESNKKIDSLETSITETNTKVELETTAIKTIINDTTCLNSSSV